MHDSIPLWPVDGAPDHAASSALTPFLLADPESAPTVVICPGGSYRRLSLRLGEAAARWLNVNGINAALLRYRLAPRYRHPAMVYDAQRAIRLVRDHARIWNLRNARVGIMGFSAGGHLASTAAVHFATFVHEADDLVEVHSAKPDAAVLCYPVIDMAGEHTHLKSRNNLLGAAPNQELAALLSTHRHVTSDTPPTFLWHAADDDEVTMHNSLQFAAACRKKGVPVELHVYEGGHHGMGLAKDQPRVATWTDHCLAFLRRHLRMG